MNQATSRRLRARMLLLIVPLLMASAPSTPQRPSVVVNVPGQPDHLAFVDLPSAFALGRCMELGVELRDITEAPVTAPTQLRVLLMGTLMGGAFYDQSGCSNSPVDAVDIPAGAPGRQVWYLTPLAGTLMLTASAGTLGAASSPLFTVLQTPLTTDFELTPESSTVTAGVPAGFIVRARVLTDTDSQYAGTVHFSTTSAGVALPQDYTFMPAVDKGMRKFFVTFRQAGSGDVKVEDHNNSQIQSRSASVTVQAAPATGFRLEGFPSDVRAGTPITFTLIPLDASGNDTVRIARLQFSSDGSKDVLPPNTPATDTVNLPAQFTVMFATPSPTPRKLTITDIYSGSLPPLDSYINVLPGAPASMVVSVDTTTPPACGKATIKLEARDILGNPTPAPAVVTLCKDPNRSATIDSNGLSPAPANTPPPPANCVTGELRGTALVVWTDLVEEEVQFTASGLGEPNPIKITWSGSSGPRLEASTLQFVETNALRPALITYTGKLTLKLTVNDLCRHPAPLPADYIPSFVGESPLAVSDPAQQDPQFKNVWTASVRLAACPADPSQPLAIKLLINNAQPSVPIVRRVEPVCVPPPVEIKLLTATDGLSVEPGDTADFEVEVSNSSDTPISDGVLMASNEGLTVIGASLDGKPLTAKGTGFALAELRKGAPLKLKVQAQAITQPAETVVTKLRCEDSTGIRLSEETPVQYKGDKLGVDVGCGCHSATPASQLLPWLLLLLVGSRPWGGLRRLRRGERTEH